MLRINSKGLDILKNCIGKKLYAVFSDKISFSDIEVTFDGRELRVIFLRDCGFELRSDFFENENGEMFHDYEIKENKPYKEGMSSYTINLDIRIKKIEIYGRPFSIEDFKNSPNIYNKFTGINRTDDLFIFYSANGEQFMIVMHDYLPDIRLYVGLRGINFFFDNSRSKYTIHYVLD